MGKETKQQKVDFVKGLEQISGNEFYQAYDGENYTAFCPLCSDGSDNSPSKSFSINNETGQWKCFSGKHKQEVGDNEGGIKKLLQQIKKVYGKLPTEFQKLQIQEKGKNLELDKKNSYTVEDFKQEKGFSKETLTNFGITDTIHVPNRKDVKYKRNVARIPYFYPDGTEARARLRGQNKTFFWENSYEEIIPYNLWNLQEEEHVFLIEGETDVISGTEMGMKNLIGVPGSQFVKASWFTRFFSNFKHIIVIKEPDQGGESLIEKVLDAVKQAKTHTSIYVVELDEDEEDIDNIVQKLERDNLQFREWIEEKLVNMEEVEVHDTIEIFGKSCFQPIGFRVDENIGVTKLKDDDEIPICRTPIVTSKVYNDYETGKEKVELSWQNRGRTKKEVFDREVISDSRQIIGLSSYGIDINSVNNRDMIAYFQNFESENLNQIEYMESHTRMGWLDNSCQEFVPYSSSIEYTPESNRINKKDFQASGDKEEYIENLKQLRQDKGIHALNGLAFVPPLLKVINGRRFLLHLRAFTESGKTALAALNASVYAKPENTMVNFNTTINGLEASLSEFNDLPVIIDELQVMTNKHNLENMIYMFSTGQGKSRANKKGGTRKLNRWETVGLTTGEESILEYVVNPGAQTRVLQIQYPPFSSQQETASWIHQWTAENFGHLGQDWIETVKEFKDVEKEENIASKFQEFLEEAKKHEFTVETHRQAVAMVATANYFVDIKLLGIERKEAEKKVKQDIKFFEENMDNLERKNLTEQVQQILDDFIVQNTNQIIKQGMEKEEIEKKNRIVGEEKNDGRMVLKKTELSDVFNKEGITLDRALEVLKDRGLLITCKGRKDKKDTLNGYNTRYVVYWNPNFNPRAKEEKEKIEKEREKEKHKDVPF